MQLEGTRWSQQRAPPMRASLSGGSVSGADKVFQLFIEEGKIDRETGDQMRGWPHSDCSVDNSIYLAPHDTSGLQRLAEYILRCPFSLARVVRLTDDGSVIYRAEKDHCRRFPGPASAALRGGPKRNFQVFCALDFLAEVTQHIPDKGEHLVRYYGWYSHRQRGIRKKARQAGEAVCGNLSIDHSALDAQNSATEGPRPGSISTWAMLIKRVYEVDPLECPCCGGQMKIVTFIERCQGDVIERILRHCGQWEGPIRTGASALAPPDQSHRVSAELSDPQFVPDPEYLESEFRKSESRKFRADATRVLQLVLDPDFL
jgi:hypothetical protein